MFLFEMEETMNRRLYKIIKDRMVAIFIIICLPSNIMANGVKRVILMETMPVSSVLEHSNAPIVFGTKLDSVKKGALMHITPNLKASARESALIADRILKGKNPGQIPITAPFKFDLGLNLATALKLKIVIPPDIFKMAGENIYR